MTFVDLSPSPPAMIIIRFCFHYIVCCLFTARDVLTYEIGLKTYFVDSPPQLPMMIMLTLKGTYIILFYYTHIFHFSYCSQLPPPMIITVRRHVTIYTSYNFLSQLQTIPIKLNSGRFDNKSC